MKAIVIYEPGGPERLIYTEVPTPEVKEGWSLVRVRGFGINHSEVFTRNGLSPSVEFPRILGIECVGEIARTSDPERLHVGQKVISIMGEMGRAFDGSYAEYALLPNEQIYPVETEMPWDLLAAIPETYYTAYGSMKNLRIELADKILVRGATSGVGVAFLRLVKSASPDIFVAGTSRNLKKSQTLLDEGFDEVIEDRDGVLQTDKSFDKVLELIGPATLKNTFAHVNEGGIVCSTGQLGGQWFLNDFDPIFELPANGYLTSFYSGNVSAERIQEMLDFVHDHKVDARPEKVFGLEEVPEAHEYLDSSRSYGKIVCVTE
ncbi:MAG: zinc-binding dehydrogenase [Mogibacterium sp.]|nr:zinc-binding dehydrogenase [Mogibacterium sp.]